MSGTRSMLKELKKGVCWEIPKSLEGSWKEAQTGCETVPVGKDQPR